jgi:spore germination cell wall hydrolase CwlJ-like protein
MRDFIKILFGCVLILIAGIICGYSILNISNNRNDQTCIIYSTKTDEYHKNLVLLTNLISSESKFENFIDKLYVGSTVLNWMRIEGVCMEDVIYKINRYSGVYGKNFRYDSESERAAKMLIDHGPIDSSVIYFLNPDIATDYSWKSQVMKRELVFKNKNHFFYK